MPPARPDDESPAVTAGGPGPEGRGDEPNQPGAEPNQPGAEAEPRGEAGQRGEASGTAELVAAVSHEVRQPLASIRGFTEMMLAHWADFPEQDKLEMLGEILHEAKRVGRLLDELLEGSRLDAGPLPLRLSHTDLGDVIARALRNLEPVFPNLQASNEVPADLPAVTADRFKIEQVVSNIVENACKYGDPASVRISARPCLGPRGQEAVEVTISDRGPGVDGEVLPRVTEKFVRSNQSGPGGLGLGLWISRGIVEAHGGRLNVSSAPGRGTTVTFVIPLQATAKTGKLAGS